ncbi:hypothetical protein YC2023_087162 [Brassica napus]
MSTIGSLILCQYIKVNEFTLDISQQRDQSSIGSFILGFNSIAKKVGLTNGGSVEKNNEQNGKDKDGVIKYRLIKTRKTYYTHKMTLKIMASIRETLDSTGDHAAADAAVDKRTGLMLETDNNESSSSLLGKEEPNNHHPPQQQESKPKQVLTPLKSIDLRETETLLGKTFKEIKKLHIRSFELARSRPVRYNLHLQREFNREPIRMQINTQEEANKTKLQEGETEKGIFDEIIKGEIDF